MLPQEHRLKKTKEIERVWKSGRSFFGPLVQIKAAPNRLQVTRFAVVVGTKAEKRAVKRNLWKRRTREILRAVIGTIKPGFDVIVSAKKGSTDASFETVEYNLLGVLRAAKLIGV